MILSIKIKINYDGIEIITNFALQYKEELIDNDIFFNAYISQIGNLEGYFGHLNTMLKKQVIKMILITFLN
jgi:hypothetical protein